MGKEYNKAVCYYPAYLTNIYAEYIIQNLGLDKSQAGIKTARRNINNLRNANNTALTAQSEEEI